MKVRSLAIRLTLVLLVLLMVIGGLTLLGQLRTFRLYQAEIDQKLNRNLPEKIIASQGWAGIGLPSIEESEPLFHDLMMLNPLIELYVLDKVGTVVGYSAEKPLMRNQVALEPIRLWLSGSEEGPVLGDDPRGSGLKVFAAAPLFSSEEEEGEVGYLYIVLPSQLHDSIRDMVEGSYILKLGIRKTLAAMTTALLVGLMFFYGLTTRLRRLASGMDQFRDSGSVPELDAGAGVEGDELDRLTASFLALSNQIRSQIDALIRADVQRRELIAGISHDLRTPLTILRGYLETLQVKEASLSEDDRRLSLASALRQAEHLSDLVSQLFELATLDADHAQLEREGFSIGDLVQDVAQKFSLRATEQSVRLKTECREGLPLVDGDLRLVERVLDNLIDNAIRHTPAGGTVLVVCQGGGPRVQVEVADSGEGIPESELGKIFEPFYRPGPGKSRGAAGLGLAIVRRVLELHETTIEVESTPGDGSRFCFRLPVHLATEVQGSPA